MSREQLSTDVLTECHDLVLTVAPELAGAPLYVVNRPANHPATGGIEAYTRPGIITWDVRDALIEQGAWRGPGSTIVFCQGVDRSQALAVAVHEAAHLLPMQALPPDVEPTDAMRAGQHAGIAMTLSQAIDESAVEPRWVNDHGAAFVRNCLHLHHRAWLAGYEICLHKMACGGWRYDLSDGWRYKFAIADEPKRLEAATFAEIASTPAPGAFTALFQNDVAYWRSNHPNYEGNLS
jgi:hypothetical protein